MDKKKMYIMTYDHGGFVLWQEAVARQLKQAIEWLEKYPDFKIGLDYEAFTFDEMAKTAPVPPPTASLCRCSFLRSPMSASLHMLSAAT